MPNRLASETSPYLLQHAENPVDWYPWGEEALAAAREADKPILLSIGYSSCHWCHVMAHESFEDAATAAVMNRHFISIKLDREERPDLDRIYQMAHQILTQQGGGWPLTIFLDPKSQIPFFSGTYFPKRARHQLPGFTDLLMRISELFTSKRDELDAQSEKIREVFKAIVPDRPADGALPPAGALAHARDGLSKIYDSRDGGFGGAPKFPMPAAIERLLRHWSHGQRDDQHDRDALDMAMTTLTQMARGGIYDHVGGGFFRYATDRAWTIPHFEKMLYDNGSLLSVYADALAIGPEELFAATAAETARWVQREMQHGDGGYFASLDADSDGTEGKFYIWRRPEVKKLLDEDEYLIVETLYGMDKPANFEGKWNLHRLDAWRSVVQRLSMQRPAADDLLASARAKLFEARSQRVPPNRDDKILTSWNGLMIKGMAKAGYVLDDPTIIDSAVRAADFLRQSLWQDGQLYASWTETGGHQNPAYLDDYANLLDGLLALMQVRWRDEDARFAMTLADALLANFEDDVNGGFFFTSHHHETLIHRPKPTVDDAMPAGNGVATRALHKLGHLFAEQRYIEAAERALVWASTLLTQHPAGHCTLLGALEDVIREPELVVINGPGEAIRPWQVAAQNGYQPWRSVFAISNDVAVLRPTQPPFLPKMMSAEDRARPVAYVCTGLSCSLPIRDLDELTRTLA